MRNITISLALLLCVIPSAYANDSTNMQSFSVHSTAFDFSNSLETGIRRSGSVQAAISRLAGVKNATSSARSGRSSSAPIARSL